MLKHKTANHSLTVCGVVAAAINDEACQNIITIYTHK